MVTSTSSHLEKLWDVLGPIRIFGLWCLFDSVFFEWIERQFESRRIFAFSFPARQLQLLSNIMPVVREEIPEDCEAQET
jgi:hypothetical protein